MNSIYIKARAKINLTLNVLDKRSDGYHNLESVFQKISLYDEIFIEKIDEDKFELETNIKEIKSNQNIVYKAYIELKNAYPNAHGVKVRINKKIPMQAGLGGGSADCASFILGMNKLYELNMTEEKIKIICEKLGSDVIPCLYNGALKAEGKGEIITQLNSDFKYYMLIVKPNFSCGTGSMYKKIDEMSYTQKYNMSNMIEALKNSDINKVCQNLYNVFEEVIDEKGEINNFKLKLLKSGALGTILCGSGSCVCGIFENKENAKRAYYDLKKEHEVYLCSSFNYATCNFST